MIATLEGVVSEKIGQQAVVVIGGVGYGILITLNNLDRVVVGEKTKFYIHENIKEEVSIRIGTKLKSM